MSDPSPSLSRRLGGFALRAVGGTLVAVALLGVLELILRLLFGAPIPLFVRARWDPATPAFEVSEGLVEPVFQAMDAVPAFTEEPDAPRVMFVGGSSVRGGSMPLAPELEFAGLLDGRLPDAEVLNLGRPAMDSASIAALLEQAVAFEPDVVVLYLGHNDIGNLTMKKVLAGGADSWVFQARHAASHLAIFAALESLVPSDMAHGSPNLPPVPQADRDEAVAGLRTNLERILALLEEGGVKPILVTPVVNRWGSGPIGPTCSEQLPRRLWDRSDREYRLFPDRLRTGDLDEAPDDCPEVLWLRAHAEDRPELVREAIDRDPVPIRATTRILDVIRQVAREHGVTLVDLDGSLSDRADHKWFIDPVHLSASGHRQVAHALLPVLRETL